MYVAIERKPESGGEIQNSACGKSGVMLRLKIVKHIESEDLHLVEGPDELPHGTCRVSSSDTTANKINPYYLIG